MARLTFGETKAGVKAMKKHRKHLAWAIVLTAMGVNISSFCPSAYCYPVLGNSGVLAQTPDEGKATADRLLEQGKGAYNNGQFPEAVASWQKAREIYRQIGAVQEEWQVLGHLGTAYQQMGEASRALALFQEQLNIAQQLNNIVNIGLSLLNLGGGYMTAGDQNQALVYSKKGLEIARELKTGEFRDFGMQLEDIAISQIIISYQLLQDWPEALAWLEEDLAIARALADISRTGEDLYQMASIYQELDDLLAAESALQQSLNIAIDAEKPILQAQSLRSLSTLYLSWGNFGKSREYAEQTLTLVRQLKTAKTTRSQLSRIEQNFLSDLESQALSQLASVYLFTGEIERGLQYSRENLAIVKTSQNPTAIADAISQLGFAYYIAGDYQQAESLLTESLDIYRDNISLMTGEVTRQIQGKMLFILGQVKLALGDRDTALAYARENLAIAREYKNLSGEASALVNLGWTLWQTGKWPEAETTLREAIKKIAPLRAKLSADPEKQRGFFDIFDYDAYELLQQVLIAGDRPIEALQVAEEGRARTFVELLAARVAPNHPEIVAPTIEELQKIAREQNATLVEYSIIYDALQTILPSRIGGGQANLEAELFIWVIKPSGEITFRRSDLKSSRQKSGMSLTELVRLSRWEMGVRGRPLVGIQPRQITPANSEARSHQNKLQKLHDILIAPIADLLPNNPSERIVFIPQGALFLVPFPALQDAAGNYLISQHTILAAPAMQALALTSGARQPGSGGVLVAGNPIMPTVGNPPLQLSPLPGAEAEVRSIAGILNTTALIGGAATKQAILQQLPGARIVHLATHGLLDGVGEGVPGAIALAPSGGDSGLLAAGEILDLKLNAELVVLSACDTGRGRITGDGVVGLSQSLMTAGAKSVIVSLWSVPDAPTAELMAEFYRHWQQNPDKAQALRSAMLAVMKSHPEPINWAGFTLMGAAE
ncbi:MAG TPA: CHAT domain-containing protein [Oscillatoriaceae cyanobacterium M33_DOE_052]|uniref:CHAT domain-containing protein n=1 Tax=Planktothricoides sp. SpSt-374 TaxID=2282167 RepID=A0A7C3VRF4_9CYAN|nr:CHAT domain-containing protein [Oscillatoriaceae cyanobacterium M33_DOE_052]